MDVTTVYLIAGAAFVASWLVRRWLQSTYTKWSKVPNSHGITGAQTAAAILARNGIDNVRIESVKGELTDHYDPDRDILRLSADNFHQTSVAAMAVSAHEAGHAVQDAKRDVRMALRRFLVPIAALGSRLGPTIVLFGLVSGSDFMIRTGIFLLFGMLLFQLATLPVEFNASRRALRNLRELGLMDGEQGGGARTVLTAAAFTYVAGAALSFAYLATLVGGGRRTSI